MRASAPQGWRRGGRRGRGLQFLMPLTAFGYRDYASDQKQISCYSSTMQYGQNRTSHIAILYGQNCTSHIAHRNSVWPKSHIAHRTSQFCMACHQFHYCLMPIASCLFFHLYTKSRPACSVRLVIECLANHRGHAVTATVRGRQNDEEFLRLT